MKKLFFTSLLFIAFPVCASHIVGGEFELLHISGNHYQLNMILYFDVNNGNPLSKDLYVIASIWRKSDNKAVQEVNMPLVTETPVGYTQPACSQGILVTNKLTYSRAIILPDAIYNDPAGYYISWQRCCRNYSILNIYSEDPSIGELSAGQTFYLEFPPIIKNGIPFYNSSPRLFPPLNDYACPNRPYYVNFAGVDDDGDSLVYTMVTPLNTQSSLAVPPAGPGPYPDVTWRPGYSLTNIIGGNPDLRISLDGFLRCTPITQGLFVFAVKIEQFRNKLKIGESRRDFQMFVVDACAHDDPPVVIGKKNGDASFTYSGSMSVTFSSTTPDSTRCIQVQVSDPDSQTALDNYTQNVGIRIIPLNFKSTSPASFLPSITTATLTNGSSHNFSICFPKCPVTPTGSFQIGIIAYDDACSLPETDTLKVTVNIVPPPNSAPYFVLPSSLPLNATLNEGDQMTWPFEIVDPDGDSILISSFGQGFILDSAGMTVIITENKKGLIAGTLHWDAFCNIYNFTKSTTFKVSIVADDIDLCNVQNPATGLFNLNVILPGVADVFIDTDLTTNPHEQQVNGLIRKVGESLNFNVTGTQADNDYLLLGVKGVGFNLSDYGMSYPLNTGNGTVSSEFQWDITCTNIDIRKKSFFSFYFTVLDNKNKCRIAKKDSVEVSVTVVAPTTAPPTLVIESLNSIPIVNNAISITLGEAISLSLIGTSTDPFPAANSLQLSMIESTGTVAPTEYTFSNVSGAGTVVSPFLWHPDCAIFKSPVYKNEYTFKFNLIDKACYATLGDTVQLNVTISDTESDFSKFSPPDVITPNGDNCNDYFALDGLDDDDEAIANCHRSANADNLIALPLDNCTAQFQYIRIINRWGKEVFHSSDRKFRWYAQSADAGVYYYLIGFGNNKYKGSLSVRP